VAGFVAVAGLVAYIVVVVGADPVAYIVAVVAYIVGLVGADPVAYIVGLVGDIVVVG